MDCPAVSFSDQKVPSREEWELYRATITKLYRDEKRPLENVIELMLSQYGFKANARMYKKRITDWNIRRNLRWSEKERICQAISHRLPIMSLRATIVVNGQEKQLALFTRHMKAAAQRRRARYSQYGPQAVGEAQSAPDSGFVLDPQISRYSLVRHTCVPKPMYPAGDRRVIEIICGEISYACTGYPGDYLSYYAGDLHNTLMMADKYAAIERYRDARILVNKADQWTYDLLTLDPVNALFGLITCLRLQSRVQFRSFDAVGLFYTHALKMSNAIHGLQHPISIALSLFFKLDRWGDMIIPALMSALSTIQGISRAHRQIAAVHWLNRCLVEMLEKSGEHDRAESVLLEMVDAHTQAGSDEQHRTTAAYDLAWHYLIYDPSNHDKAEPLLEGIHDAYVELSKTQSHARFFHAYYAGRGLAKLAAQRGDHDKAVELTQLRLTAAVEFWGQEDAKAHRAADKLARLFEEKGTIDAAEEARNMLKLTDDLISLGAA